MNPFGSISAPLSPLTWLSIRLCHHFAERSRQQTETSKAKTKIKFFICWQERRRNLEKKNKKKKHTDTPKENHSSTGCCRVGCAYSDVFLCLLSGPRRCAKSMHIMCGVHSAKHIQLNSRPTLQSVRDLSFRKNTVFHFTSIGGSTEQTRCLTHSNSSSAVRLKS